MRNHERTVARVFAVLLALALSIPTVLMSASIANAEIRVVNNPTIFGQRLDWCARWGIGCGRDAARQYCRSFHGMNDAVDWRQDRDIGLQTPTRTLFDARTCAAGFCDGFKQIKCQTLHRTDRLRAACSSTMIFTNGVIANVRQVAGGFRFRARADGVREANVNVLLRRNDPHLYQIRLPKRTKKVNFFCLNNGSWHRENITCERSSDVLVINRLNGGGRKVRVHCYRK